MWSKRGNRTFAGGMSLVELAISGAIIVVVCTIALVVFVRYRFNADDGRMQGELTSINKAMLAYRQVYGRYPGNYNQLSEFISIPNFDARYSINPSLAPAVPNGPGAPGANLPLPKIPPPPRTWKPPKPPTPVPPPNIPNPKPPGGGGSRPGGGGDRVIGPGGPGSGGGGVPPPPPSREQ